MDPIDKLERRMLQVAPGEEAAVSRIARRLELHRFKHANEWGCVVPGRDRAQAAVALIGSDFRRLDGLLRAISVAVPKPALRWDLSLYQDAKSLKDLIGLWEGKTFGHEADGGALFATIAATHGECLIVLDHAEKAPAVLEFIEMALCEEGLPTWLSRFAPLCRPLYAITFDAIALPAMLRERYSAVRAQRCDEVLTLEQADG